MTIIITIILMIKILENVYCSVKEELEWVHDGEERKNEKA